jgi:uncharacterized FlaG/YvyC family protein
MAGTISLVAGAAAEVLSPPDGSFAKRSGLQRAENRGLPKESMPGQATGSPRAESAQDGRGLASTVARGQNAGSSHKTMLIFERDDKSGKMYLYIRDKRTGEEVVRIPRKLLGDAEPEPEAGSRVDIRV